MKNSSLLRLGSIKGRNGLLNALLHNKRLLQRERDISSHIDFAKSSLNYCLAGDETPQKIAEYANFKKMKAGISKPRKNGVMAVEILFSLPTSWHLKDSKPFFIDSHQWTLQNFAGELLSFDVHLDESAPHAHAIILPLVEGKMQGNKMKGNIANLRRLDNLFQEKVASKHGLTKSNVVRLSVIQKSHVEQAVLSRLKSDSLINSIVYSCVRDNIRKDPIPYAQLLGIDFSQVESKKTRSFVEIMTSKGKGTQNRLNN